MKALIHVAVAALLLAPPLGAQVLVTILQDNRHSLGEVTVQDDDHLHIEPLFELGGQGDYWWYMDQVGNRLIGFRFPNLYEIKLAEESVEEIVEASIGPGSVSGDGAGGYWILDWFDQAVVKLDLSTGDFLDWTYPPNDPKAIAYLENRLFHASGDLWLYEGNHPVAPIPVEQPDALASSIEEMDFDSRGGLWVVARHHDDVITPDSWWTTLHYSPDPLSGVGWIQSDGSIALNGVAAISPPVPVPVHVPALAALAATLAALGCLILMRS